MKTGKKTERKVKMIWSTYFYQVLRTIIFYRGIICKEEWLAHYSKMPNYTNYFANSFWVTKKHYLNIYAWRLVRTWSDRFIIFQSFSYVIFRPGYVGVHGENHLASLNCNVSLCRVSSELERRNISSLNDYYNMWSSCVVYI